MQFTERVVVENGVYAYYSDGSLKPLSDADSNAIGVAVIDDDAMFVIDKNDVSGTKAFGGYQKDLTGDAMLASDSATALTDFDGYRNTANIIFSCAGYTDTYYNVTGAPAAEACREQFNGNGYLAAAGEWYAAYQNKTAVDNMMTAIGGTALTSGYYWASTLHGSLNQAWLLRWSNDNVINDYRGKNYYVRAFAALNTSLTLTLVASDSSSVSGLSVTTIDKNGVFQTLTTDSTGKVIFSSVACGEVKVIVNGRMILNGDTFTVNRNSSTQRITLNITSTNSMYAYYSDGSLKPLSQADSTAIGVAVIDDDATFVIGKDTVQKAFGGYNTVNLTGTAMLTTDSATVLTDFDGYRNTSRIMNALKNQAGNAYSSYPATTGAPAAEWCRTQFSGEGYLPSCGEMYLAYQHKTDIDVMMTAIEGTAMGTDYYHWTSTHYNATQNSWGLGWSGGGTGSYYRFNYGYYVRAFQLIKTSITLTLSATDSSSISGQTVLISDKAGNVQTAVSDSNGQVTFSNVACGQTFVSVKKCLVNSNRTIKVTPFGTSFTIGFRTPNVGLYYYSLDANGNGVLDSSSATNAIGVAVVTSNCAFVIDKRNFSYSKAWGGYNVDLSGIGVPVSNSSNTDKDSTGEKNSAKIINALYQVQGEAHDTYPATYGAPALEACTTAFNGKGYLPSIVEWKAAYQNKSSVVSMISAIGGTAINTSNYYWSSTMYDSNSSSYVCHWNNGTFGGIDRFYNSYLVRAFSAL